MKNRNLLASCAVVATLALLVPWAGNVAAQGSSLSAAPAATVAPPAGSAVQLSPAVQDVLKLSRAKVSDDITIAFIRNSGSRFSLTAAEIVYLRNEGESDQVIAAMLNQPSGPAVTPAPATPQPAAAAPLPTPSASAPAFSPVATVYQVAPAYAPAPTVYVVSEPRPSYYPAYPYYYGCVYPAISIGFGTRWGYGHGGYYHGGYYRGGGHHR